MKTEKDYNVRDYARLALKTREFDTVYVPVRHRDDLQHGDIHFTVSAYGRGGRHGNRYKMHAIYEDGSTVPSHKLEELYSGRQVKKVGVEYYARLALQTRKFGSCYVHVGNRHYFVHKGMEFAISSYGRSLEAGGHKFKVHAEYEDGKPVPSKILEGICNG